MNRSILLLAISAALALAAPPPLPKALTSFGAASSEGFVYVFGGHTGKAHDYSKSTVNGTMWRLSLSKQDGWEELPGTVPMQSPGVAAWNGKIYLAGGMQPQNDTGEKQRLLSMDDSQMFDPNARAWTKLRPLPQPRSSHAIAVLDGKLYVAGGWPLNIGAPVADAGKPPQKKYHDTMVVLDLAHADAGWKTLPQPWRRRALTALAFAGGIWCIGGMTEDNKLTSAVNVFDPSTEQWSIVSAVPEAGQFEAFGCAACAVKDALFVSPAGGKVFRIGADAKTWIECGQLAKARYFHQLIALDETHLLVIGGTSDGKPMDDVEVVAVSRNAP